MARLRDLLRTIADAKDPALDIEIGANVIPDRHHLAHANGDLVAALGTVAREAHDLLQQLPDEVA